MTQPTKTCPKCGLEFRANADGHYCIKPMTPQEQPEEEQTDVVAKVTSDMANAYADTHPEVDRTPQQQPEENIYSEPDFWVYMLVLASIWVSGFFIGKFS